MKVDSLQELEAAFATWRRERAHARERTPLLLVVRAREAARRHGLTAVVRATGIDRSLLGRVAAEGADEEVADARKAKTEAKSKPVPAFSRIALSAPPAPSARPLAEVETAAGVKLRVFEQTPEMLSLLAAACGCGGNR